MIRSVKYAACVALVALALNAPAQLTTDSIGVVKVANPVPMKKKAVKAIARSIFKSEYKDWKVTEAQQEVFRNSDTDTLLAYKITIINNENTRYLFYKKDGMLLLDKPAQP